MLSHCEKVVYLPTEKLYTGIIPNWFYSVKTIKLIYTYA